MSRQPSHTANSLFRHIIAAGMTVLYLAVIFSPLASFAMHGAKSASTGIRECSGDCTTCGCSPESRASNTCCCSKKRQQLAHNHGDGHEGAADCCNKTTGQHADTHQKDNDSTPDCCNKDTASQEPVIISCGCPCGNGKQDALSTYGSSEVLLYHFMESLTIPHTDTTYSSLTQRLASRHGEPPEPPPQNS